MLDVWTDTIDQPTLIMKEVIEGKRIVGAVRHSKGDHNCVAPHESEG